VKLYKLGENFMLTNFHQILHDSLHTHSVRSKEFKCNSRIDIKLTPLITL